MKLLVKPTKITQPTPIDFTLTKSAWYLLSVSARVRGRKQLGGKETDDEDLRLEIDGRQFPKLDDPHRLFDSPAAFSGGKIHGQSQTILFVINFSPGYHKLNLIPDKGAEIEEIGVEELIAFPRIQLDLEQKAETANGRPWLTFVLVDLGLTAFEIEATVRWRFPDGDDIKVVVDGETKKNNLSLLHRHWVLASNILKRLLSRETVERRFAENLKPGKLHYLEFWADESPTIHSLQFDFQPSPETSPKTYRPGPRGENFNRFDHELEQAVNFWNKEFLTQKEPPPQPLDPNLVKAIVYVESRMGYGSSLDGQPAFPDVMQIADEGNPAIHTLRNDGWVDPRTGRVAREFEWINNKEEVLRYKEANGNSPAESIKWGIRWLCHKAQGIKNGGGRFWKSWEQAVTDYNGGGDPRYQQKVNRIYKEGLDLQGTRLWSLVVLTALSLFSLYFTLLGGFLLYEEQGQFHTYKKSVSNGRDFDFYLKVLDGLRTHHFALSRYQVNGADFTAFYDEGANIINYLTPLTKDRKLIAIRGSNIADQQVVAMLEYRKGKFYPLYKENKYGALAPRFLALDYVSFENLDNDPEEEIIEQTTLRYDTGLNQVWRDFYDFDRQKHLYRFKETTKSPPSLFPEENTASPY